MIHFCILLALALCWMVLLDKRSKLMQEKKKRKQQLKATELKVDSNYDPEYFVWKFSNPEDFGE